MRDAVEFLKVIGSLSKGDDALLVCVLERYAAHGKPQQRVQAFYDDDLGVPHIDYPKNLMRITIGYSELLRLSGHSYNIFEFAFLNANELKDPDGRLEAVGYLVTSLFTCLLQFLVFSCLCFYNIGPDYDAFREKYGQITAYRDDSAFIVVIAFGTTLLFCKRAYMQFSGAREFNEVFTKLQMREGAGAHKVVGRRTMLCKKACLWVNTAVNCGLAVLVPAFNLYYLLLSDSIDDAVLNSLALLFILELDEVVLPSWDEDRIEDELASNMLVYIGKEAKRDNEVVVVKVSALSLCCTTCDSARTPRAHASMNTAPC